MSPPPFHTCLFVSVPPRRRGNLEKTKARLIKEQQLRTDRRVRELLHPRNREEDVEVDDDSEEENRLRPRCARATRDQGTQTDRSVWSCCCGVFIGVFVIVLLLCLITSLSGNGRQRLAE